MLTNSPLGPGPWVCDHPAGPIPLAMGFFDEAKAFMGGHGVTVQLTRIEQ